MITEPIEEFWENMLSRDANKIKAAYSSLSKEEKLHVLSHLSIMRSESGWHNEQRISAEAALEVILHINDD